MKRIIVLFFIVNILCFSTGNNDADEQVIVKDYSTTLVRNYQESTEKEIEELNARIENLEKEIKYRTIKEDNGGYIYNLDQIYANSIKYYDKAIDDIDNSIGRAQWILGLIVTMFIFLAGFFQFRNDKVLKEEKIEIKNENKELTTDLENKIIILENEVNKKIEKYEGLMKNQKIKFEKDMRIQEERFNKNIRLIEFNSELGIAINKKNNEERIEELKYIEMREFGLSDTSKSRLYATLGYYTEGFEAISYYNKVLNLKLEDKYSYFHRACLYYDLKIYKKSRLDYNKVIDLDPLFIDAYRFIGYIELEQEHYDLAILEFNKAININPDYAVAYSDRGLANLYLENLPQAISDFDKAIDLDPKMAIPYANKGYAIALSGDFNTGLEFLEKSIEIDKDIQFNSKIPEKEYNKFLEFLKNKNDLNDLGKEIYRRLKDLEGIEVI